MCQTDLHTKAEKWQVQAWQWSQSNKKKINKKFCFKIFFPPHAHVCFLKYLPCFTFSSYLVSILLIMLLLGATKFSFAAQQWVQHSQPKSLEGFSCHGGNQDYVPHLSLLPSWLFCTHARLSSVVFWTDFPASNLPVSDLLCLSLPWYLTLFLDRICLCLLDYWLSCFTVGCSRNE